MMGLKDESQLIDPENVTMHQQIGVLQQLDDPNQRHIDSDIRATPF